MEIGLVEVGICLEGLRFCVAVEVRFYLPPYIDVGVFCVCIFYDPLHGMAERTQ